MPGYVAWRGTLGEADAPPDLVRFFNDAFTFSEARSAGHILAYFIPGDGGDTSPGMRRLNWVWYVGVREADLPRLLIDRDGRQHHASLPFGGTPDSAIRDLRDLARREVHPMLAALVAATPQPFLQTIVDVAPTRTVFGRVCLLGDAAFVVRPHTAGATAKAARDATTLARALKRAGQNVDAGLSRFEEMQIGFGRELVDYGVALGRTVGGLNASLFRSNRGRSHGRRDSERHPQGTDGPTARASRRCQRLANSRLS